MNHFNDFLPKIVKKQNSVANNYRRLISNGFGKKKCLFFKKLWKKTIKMYYYKKKD